VARVSITPSVRIPLPELSGGELDGLPVDRDTPILTLCASGNRSIYAQMLLKAQGYTDVRNVDGGINEWVATGLPTG
jgi:rhodanese-related sulfurtransferase